MSSDWESPPEQHESSSTGGIKNNLLINPYQQSAFSGRVDGLNVRCFFVDIVNGLLGPEGGTFATLVVLQFHFSSTRPGYRVKAANIKLTVEEAAGRRSGMALEVHSMAPDVIITSLDSRTTIVGSKVLSEWGEPNAASWELWEDETTKTGLPEGLRTVVLFTRQDNTLFQLKLVMKIKGSTWAYDSLLYHPGMPPTNRLMKYDTDNLASIDLTSLLILRNPDDL